MSRKEKYKEKKKRNDWEDFPGSPVDKNLPSNARDLGSIPGRGTRIPHASEQLSPHARVLQLSPNTAKK